ncbi:MAG: hypothetical protein IIT98_02260 [Kiritimatiellae bacterium]|nr:hypothetical protein [Kiritimatiellia bacterium]
MEEGKAVIFSYGGVEEGNKRSISICRTAEGKLVAQTVQNWGGGVNATSSIELGDDADRIFHTLVIVNERNIKTDYQWGWASGMQSFYLDGKFAGAISDGNGQERALMDTFRYGAIYNRTFDGITEPAAESGLAFRDLRFAAKVWTSAEAKAYAIDRQLAGEDYLFDYRFTSGAKHFYGDGLSDFVTTAAGYTPVNGTDGYGTAVHACGYGAIPDGGSILNNGDWTLATSFKSCAVSNGVILALGGDGRATEGRELRILSSSVPGELLLGVVQTYSYGGRASAYQNMPASLALTDLGDTTGSFHSLVLVFTASDKTLKAYWDGEYKGEFNSAQGMGTLFRSWLQFGQSKNSVLGYDSEDGTNYTLVNPALVHVPTAYHPDTAFQDVRLFGKALGDDEIAAYAAMFPAAAATKSNIDDYGFRHDFSSGRLVMTGEGCTDGDGEGADGIAGTGTRVFGPRLDGKYVKAAFPSKDGYATIDDGLNRDWTIAMYVKAPSVSDGNAVMFSFGGLEESGRRSIALCSSSTGSLFVQMVQRWGASEDAVNAPASLDLGGDVADGKFHTIVVVNERNIKNTDDPSYPWNTGMLSFYLDGEYRGSFTDKNGQERTLMDKIRYGALYNRTHSSVAEPGEESGLAFCDLRFIPRVWTGAEAADYSAAFPVAEQSSAPGFTIFLQ